MVASLFIVPQGICIAGVCIVFSVLSHSARFGGMIVHIALSVYVLLASVSSSTTSFVTLSATATAMVYVTDV